MCLDLLLDVRGITTAHDFNLFIFLDSDLQHSYKAEVMNFKIFEFIKVHLNMRRVLKPRA